MSDNKNMQVSDDALDSVAGGIGSFGVNGSVTGDVTVTDNSKNTTSVDNSTKIGGDYTGGDKDDHGTHAGGDVTGGNKTDVDTNTNVDVDIKRKLF